MTCNPSFIDTPNIVTLYLFSDSLAMRVRHKATQEHPDIVPSLKRYQHVGLFRLHERLRWPLIGRRLYRRHDVWGQMTAYEYTVSCKAEHPSPTPMFKKETLVILCTAMRSLLEEERQLTVRCVLVYSGKFSGAFDLQNRQSVSVPYCRPCTVLHTVGNSGKS